MRSLSYILFFALFLLVSCSSDEDELLVKDELEGLVKLQTLENDTHLVELYTASGLLEEGYNEIFLRIRKQGEQTFLQNVQMSWMPMMHMTSKEHSAPHSGIHKVQGKESLYSGYLIFQMPENASESWSLTLNYSIGGENYSLNDGIAVRQSAHRRVSVFTGTDGIKYILALVGPREPKVASNDAMLALYRMNGMMDFSLVNGFTIKIDPRMPAMDNHSSPNNADLVQGQGDVFYYGKINLTMTGYWKINLQLLNETGEVLKGEPVTETNEGSSLFLELEF